MRRKLKSAADLCFVIAGAWLVQAIFSPAFALIGAALLIALGSLLHWIASDKTP